jgi:hypothetical protein
VRRGRAAVRECEHRRRWTKDKVCLIGLGRIRTPDTYQPTYPKFMKKKKKSDTLPIRIGGVSDTYPYPKRIGYAIRAARDISV